MKTYVEKSRTLRVRDEADVIVAGAGTAGCIAAIAAAREGAKVIIIDKAPYPSGTLGNGGLIFNSLYASSDDNKDPLRLVYGLCGELVDRLIAEGASPGFIPTRLGNHYRRPFVVSMDHEALKATLSAMLIEAGVTVYLRTWISDVIQEDGVLSGVIIESKAGREVILGKQFVDATGDGDLARHAGCPQKPLWQNYGVDQHALVFGMDGVDFEKLCAEGVKEGFISEGDSIFGEGGTHVNGFLRVSMRFGNSEKYRYMLDLGLRGLMGVSVHPNQITYSNSVGIKLADIHDPVAHSKAEMQARQRVQEVCRLLRENIPGFENAFVYWAATELGIRVSDVTLCEKIITQEDVMGCVRCEDEIGLFGYHDLLPVAPDCAVPANQCFGIPYRAIIPLGAENLLMSGRTISDTFRAHMVTRNTVPSMITGQAAGTAAALCAKENLTPRQLPYPKLREALLKANVKLEL